MNIPSKKRIITFLMITILIFLSLLLYLRLPQRIYKSAFIVRTLPYAPASETGRIVPERSDDSFANRMPATDEEAKEQQELTGSAKAVEQGMPVKRYMRSLELDSPGSVNVFRGMAIEHERSQLKLERIGYEFGLPHLEGPYQEHLEEVYVLLEERGYDRDELYSHYESYMRKAYRWVSNATKVQQILALADQTDIALFLPEVEKLFEDKNNLGLMLLRVSAYYAQLMTEELFAEIRAIIIALDHFESKHVDKHAILYYILESASARGYIPIGDHVKIPERVIIGHPEFLAGLELDGNL